MLMIGLMSGTSADGIDAALCEITGARRPVILGQITPGDYYAALIRRTWGGEKDTTK